MERASVRVFLRFDGFRVLLEDGKQFGGGSAWAAVAGFPFA